MALEPLKSNLEEIFKEFLSLNGKYILTQGTDFEDFEDTLDIAKKYPNIIFPALGIHPTIFEEQILCKDVPADLLSMSQKFVNRFEKIFEENKEILKAIGETGLDYFQSERNENLSSDTKEMLKQVQKGSFRRHAQLALENDLPLSIHSRELQGETDCIKDTLQILAEVGRGQLRGSLHSYTGEIEMVDEILDLGFHIGFNAIITYPSGGNVRDILKEVPEDRILFETDGPFLVPQSVRKNNKIKKKYAKPSHVKEVIEVAAEVKGMDPKRLEDSADENFKNLFLTS
jgi:TatD DNase family protein